MTTSVSLEEYLHTSFPDGDCEYVDGTIVERNLGEVDHSSVQTSVLVWLATRYEQFWTGVSVRAQVKPTRVRVPDVCLTLARPQGRIITSPPFLVVEVLSRDDRADYIEEKVADYLEFGVKYVWVVNPRTRRGHSHTSEGSREAKDGVLRTHDPEIELPLSAMFS